MCVSLIRFYEFYKNGEDHNTKKLTIVHEFFELLWFLHCSEIGQVLSSSLRIQEQLNDILD